MPKRKLSASQILKVLQGYRPDIDSSIPLAVTAWKRARVEPRLRAQITGRTDRQNRQRARRAIQAINKITNGPSLQPHERAVLERAAAPLRATIATVFYAPVVVSNRPDTRRDGYKVLCRHVDILMGRGVPTRRAIAFIASRIVKLFPPAHNQPWLYDVTDSQTPAGALANRIQVFYSHFKTTR